MKVLVTGANGFVGTALCRRLIDDGHALTAAVRAAASMPGEAAAMDVVSLAGIDAQTDWQAAVAGCETIVHLAARVHMMRDCSADPIAAYRAVNTEGTLNLARQAVAAGVRRFVFVSSIKVNGDGGTYRIAQHVPYRASDVPHPQDPYGQSKWEAEQGLRALAAHSDLEVVIVRPPLVYGPGVKANFLRLMQLADRGWPLPLAGINNRRSLIYSGNLVSALSACATHAAAANKTFLLSDGEDVSTAELYRRICAALSRRARLIAVPPAWLRTAAGVLGKQQAADRLLGSLQVDSGEIRDTLAWLPPFSMQEGLAQTARWYRHTYS